MKHQTLSRPYTKEELLALDNADFSVFVTLSERIINAGRIAIQSFFTAYYLDTLSIVDSFEYNVVDDCNLVVNITGQFRFVGE